MQNTQNTQNILFLSVLFLGLFLSNITKTFALSSDIVILEQDTYGSIDLAPDSLGNSKLYFGENLNNFIQWRADKNAFVFSNNIDFGGNQVINFRIENLPSAPICNIENSGRVYHNTTDFYSYICDDTEWKVLDNDETSASAILPYLYNVSPNFLLYDTTTDLHVIGENLQSITKFELSEGVILNSFEILNSEEAVLHVTSKSTDIMVDVIAVNDDSAWSNNKLKVKVASTLSLETVLENFDDGLDDITEWVPELYPLKLDAGKTANYIYNGGGGSGNPVYNNGNFLGTDGKNGFNYTNKAFITDEEAFGQNGKYFTMLKNNIFILSATVGDGFTNFFTTGNLGANGNGSSDIFEFEYNGYTAYVKRVYGAGSVPSLNHIFLVDSSIHQDENGNNIDVVSHLYSQDTNNDYHELAGLDKLATIENNKFYYLAFLLKDGKYMSDDDLRSLVEFFVDKMLSNI